MVLVVFLQILDTLQQYNRLSFFSSSSDGRFRCTRAHASTRRRTFHKVDSCRDNVNPMKLMTLSHEKKTSSFICRQIRGTCHELHQYEQTLRQTTAVRTCKRINKASKNFSQDRRSWLKCQSAANLNILATSPRFSQLHPHTKPIERVSSGCVSVVRVQAKKQPTTTEKVAQGVRFVNERHEKSRNFAQCFSRSEWYENLGQLVHVYMHRQDEELFTR